MNLAASYSIVIIIFDERIEQTWSNECVINPLQEGTFCIGSLKLRHHRHEGLLCCCQLHTSPEKERKEPLE